MNKTLLAAGIALVALGGAGTAAAALIDSYTFTNVASAGDIGDPDNGTATTTASTAYTLGRIDFSGTVNSEYGGTGSAPIGRIGKTENTRQTIS